RFDLGQRGKRHHFTFVVPYVELPDLFGLGAILAFGLDVNLPLAAEAVEVVHEQSAHESLDGAVNVADGDSLLQDFVFIHIDELLGHARKKGRAQTGYLRTFARGRQEGIEVGRQERHVFSGTVLENEGESAGSTHAGNRRG